MAPDGFDSPEEAALSGYPDEAQVLSVIVEGDEATVEVRVNAHLTYGVVRNHCARRGGRWFDLGHTG